MAQAPEGFSSVPEFISYCRTHSDTPRALFHFSHVAALLRLAGRHDEAKHFEGRDQFGSYDLTEVCVQASERVRSPETAPAG